MGFNEEEYLGGESKSPSQGCDTPIDADSISGSEICSTVSLTGDVWKFEKENGRTYHGYRAGVYYYPNDPSEAERLDYQSAVLDFAFDGALHQAPISNPANVLDIGTGTGSWAVQMGDLFPNATIEATDLSPIQPTNVPENVQFIIDDAAEDDWAVPENHYDYIHTRVLMGCFEDFQEIIQKGFKHTKPGGWMESLECMHPPYCDDGTMPADWPFKEWTQTMDEAAMNAGRPLRIASRLKKWYIAAGFEDVHEKVIKIPINQWPRDRHLKQLGRYWAENLLAGLQGFSLALFSRVFGWNKTEIEIYLVKIRKSITDHHVHAYTKVYTVWGRKPDPQAESSNPETTPSISVSSSQMTEEPVCNDPASIPDTFNPSNGMVESSKPTPATQADVAMPLAPPVEVFDHSQEPVNIPLPSSPKLEPIASYRKPEPSQVPLPTSPGGAEKSAMYSHRATLSI
ncbi:S-adenosyl-L-methionine-dependent methyltransferase [Halenospora varia]|nr:S-adenosyl-L-methionine-dependent methyltransferase [Halenospora varia]